MENELKIGQKLQQGKYIIEKLLGQGGFGITYLADFSYLQTKVAIKELFLSGYNIREYGKTTVISQNTGNSNLLYDFKKRFLEEARTLAQFRHKSIVKVTDVFEENSTAYLVMDFIEGKSLSRIIAERGQLSVADTVNYIAQIADALKEVHKKDILHRDIKPDNIIVTPDFTIVLIDFGTARNFSQNDTATQTSLVTPGYAPFEQYSEHSRRGAFTDIYSLGATIYHCLTGQKPLDAIARFNSPLEPPATKNKNIGQDLNYVIMKAMEIYPENRYQDINSFLSDFLKVGLATDKESVKDDIILKGFKTIPKFKL